MTSASKRFAGLERGGTRRRRVGRVQFVVDILAVTSPSSSKPVYGGTLNIVSAVRPGAPRHRARVLHHGLPARACLYPAAPAYPTCHIPAPRDANWSTTPRRPRTWRPRCRPPRTAGSPTAGRPTRSTSSRAWTGTPARRGRSPPRTSCGSSRPSSTRSARSVTRCTTSPRSPGSPRTPTPRPPTSRTSRTRRPRRTSPTSRTRTASPASRRRTRRRSSSR